MIKIEPGQKYSRLTVLKRTKNVHMREHWLCSCSCGKETIVWARNLDDGNTKSCGCLKKEVDLAGANLKHGYSHQGNVSSEYITWSSMKQRCTNPLHSRYAYAGGRGLKMDEKWVESFEAFIKDMGNKPDACYRLERIDKNKGYDKTNCHWVARNKKASLV